MKHKMLVVTILVYILCLIFVILGYNRYQTYKLSLNKVVNLVFTTDKNYKDYLMVTLNSAVKNKAEDSIYNINILCVDLSPKEMAKYQKYNMKNVNIKTIPLKVATLNGVGDFEVKNDVTRADLFKFYMPDLFPDLDKILYIDVDTIILKDLRELYNTNLGNKYIGVVNKTVRDKRTIPLPFGHALVGPVRAYNCGVILYNLKLWRKHNITQKLINEKNKDTERELMTQNAFNIVITQRHIKKLSPIYNYNSSWTSIQFVLNEFKKVYKPYLKNINTIDELFDNTVILHYAGDYKPWNNNEVFHGEVWKQYK